VSPTSESVLEKLEAERGMYRTFVHFFRLTDTTQYGRIATECFTPDATLVYEALPDGSSRSLHGRAGIDAFYVGNSGLCDKLAHVVGQSIVEWDGERPHLTAYVTAWHWFADRSHLGEQRPADWTTVGLVEDDYERVDGTWLIARRRVTPQGGIVAVGQLPGTSLT
jgi:hypothetical protein